MIFQDITENIFKIMRRTDKTVRRLYLSDLKQKRELTKNFGHKEDNTTERLTALGKKVIFSAASGRRCVPISSREKR